MLYNNIIVFDLETGSKFPKTTDAIQIGAMVINPHTLDFIRDANGEPVFFESMMRPDNMDNLQEEALKINKKTREQIEAAPCEEMVYKNFATWVKQFHNSGRVNQWSAPIAAGFNIINFDMVVMDRLAAKYGYLNEEGGQSIFHKIYRHDVMNLATYWHHGQKDPSKYNLKALCDFYGLSTEGNHDALVDVQNTAKILIKFFKLAQTLQKKIKFKDAFKDNDS